MITMKYSGASEIITLGIRPGELLLESIRAAIKEHDIRNGVVISGVGTLKTCTMHYIEHVNFPPDEGFYTLEKPLELLSVSGIIANGEPHLHITVSCKDNETYGGHLEDKSEVAYLAEVAILKCNGLEMKRNFDEKRRIKLLDRA